MAKLILDLHDIYNQSKKIDTALHDIMTEAESNKIKEVVIIPGKGSGQLKKRVMRFLNQRHIKEKINRINIDSKNFGKLIIYLKN